jgi:hypothetical protein
VTDDKPYGVYPAPDGDAVGEHARCGGFPANKIIKVSAVIDPRRGQKGSAGSSGG